MTRSSISASLLCGLAIILVHGCTPELREGAFGDQDTPATTGQNPADAGTGAMDATPGEDAGAGGEDTLESFDYDVAQTDVGGTLNIDGEPIGGVPSMTGTWIQLQDLSTCVVIGNPVELKTRYLIKIDIVQDGARLYETYNTCRISNTPLLNLVTTVSKAVLEGSNPFFVESYLVGTDQNQGYTGGVQTHLWGLKFDDPLTDPFPDPFIRDEAGEIIVDDQGNPTYDADHPNLFDTDGDGIPGATLDLGGGACEVSMLQRALTSTVGFIQPDGSIVGNLHSITEQLILSSTNFICAQSFETFSNNSQSSMRMFRPEATGITIDTNGDGEISCDELVAVEDQLITWTEPDDARCAR